MLQSQLITNDYWHIPGRVKRKKKTLIKSFRQWKESPSSYCWIPPTFTTVYHEKCLLKIGLNSLLLFPRRTMSFSIIHSTQHLMCACKMVVITYSFHKLLWDLWIRITYFINHTLQMYSAMIPENARKAGYLHIVSLFNTDQPPVQQKCQWS